jgi:hypothetical protein
MRARRLGLVNFTIAHHLRFLLHHHRAPAAIAGETTTGERFDFRVSPKEVADIFTTG